MSGLRQKTLHGIGWMAASQVVSQAARFGFIIALARLVAPADFGLWGMALVFTGFAALIGDIGLGAALVQRPDITPAQFDTAFWINLALGLLLAGLLAALAVPLGALYGAPHLPPLLAVASLDFVVKAAAVVPRAMLMREMNFRAIAMQETAASVLAGLAACAVAIYGAGAWSLVAQSLVASAVITVWLFAVVPWRPAWRFEVAGLRDLFSFSLHLQGFNLVNYAVRNLDKLLVGRMLGETALGLYNRAYTTMLLPQTQVTGVLERVMWPALARCAGEPERLRRAYLRAMTLVCFISFPCMAGLAVVAEDFVITLFGETWRGSVITLQWLCLAGFVQAPVATLGWLYLATGRTRRLLAWSLISASVTLPAIVIGARAGSIEAMAAWYAGASALLMPAAFWYAAPVSAIPFTAIARAMAPSASSALIMAAVLIPLGDATAPLPGVARLLLCTAAGAAMYLALTWRTGVQGEARDLLFSSIRRTGAAPT